MAFLSRRKFSFLTFIACSIGLIIQIYHVASFYFSYRSKTSVEMNMPMKITIPSLSSCWRISTIFNQTKLEQSTNETFYEWKEDGFSYIDKETKNIHELSVSDLFDYTPDVDTIFDPEKIGCTLRISGKFIVRHSFSPHCYNISEIEKYIQKHYLCYKITSINPTAELEAYEYAVSPSYVGMIYKVNLNTEIFQNSNVFSAFVHKHNSSNYYDSLFAQEHYRPPMKRTENPTAHVNIRVSYQEVSIQRLRPPYDTKCRDYNHFHSNTEYKLHLLNDQTAHRFRRVTTFMQLKEHSNYSMISPEQFRNETFLKEFNQLIEDQKNKFGNPACDFTLLISSSAYSEGKLLSISVYWPMDPSIVIAYEPEQETNEFLIYVCSVVGIWYGLSMMSIFNGIKCVAYGSGHGLLSMSFETDQPVRANQLVSDQLTRGMNTMKNQQRIQSLQLDMIRGEMFSLRIDLKRIESRSMNIFMKYYNR